MIDTSPALSRRNFLRQTSAVAAATLLPGALVSQSMPAATSTEPQPKIPSRDTLLKFNPDGTRHGFAGNTVICHMPVQCAMRDAMTELHHALGQAPYRGKLGLTSIDSYHMTSFPGANDKDRNLSGWPSYVPVDAPIEVCNQMVGERMAKARLHCELPLRVQVEVPSTLHYPTACTMRMVPVDADEEKKIRAVRDQLSEIYGFRQKNHDSYQFHITMSYQLAPFTAEEQASYRALLAKHIPVIVKAEPVLEFGNPEYCTFPDMFRFDPRKLIACA